MCPSAESYDFFLCHAGADKVIVEGYAKRLQDLGASTAFDKYDIKPGQDWIERILDLLPNSKICVAFVSQHSSSAIVQGKEAFLARYLARQFPSRHQLVPVYLQGAPAQTDLHGLQTTSGFREDRQSADDIAQDLVAELRRMGDVADQATRALGMIDEVALRWLFPTGDPFGAKYELKGDEMLLLEEGQEVNAISRDQFRSKLSADELRLIEHMETKMERLFQQWEKNDLDAVTSKAAEKRADEFARRLGKEVVQLIDILTGAGFFLVDHYQHIRQVVADYYASHS
jgi:TIR domain-containing protein